MTFSFLDTVRERNLSLNSIHAQGKVGIRMRPESESRPCLHSSLVHPTIMS